MTRRIAILIGLLLQLAAVFAVLVPSEVRMRTGTPVTLLTIPVDPRSIFRGDYVTLDYEIGMGLPIDWPSGRPVYVVIAPSGDSWKRVRLADAVPALAEGQACIRGTAGFNRVEFPDIAQYFVPEGEGMELEQARNSHRLFVDVVLGGSCKGSITGLRLGPLVPRVPATTPFPPPPEGFSGAIKTAP